MRNPKSLICINTCNRFDIFRFMARNYIAYCNSTENFDFLVSLDGHNKDYIDFCAKFKIPLIYSSEREGVGLSKNRVLKTYPDYNFYFFLEDDVELLNADVFQIHIDIFNKTQLHHMSLGNKERFIEFISSEFVDKYTIIHTMYGDASFNFFSKEGLTKVGGWHTEFAKYRRFGHTEHSFRYYNTGLCPAPFNVISDLIVGYFNFHDPVSVTLFDPNIVGSYHIAKPEEVIIEQKLPHFPFQTLSQFQTNAISPTSKSMVIPKLNFLSSYLIKRKLNPRNRLKILIQNFLLKYVIVGKLKIVIKKILNKK